MFLESRICFQKEKSWFIFLIQIKICTAFVKTLLNLCKSDNNIVFWLYFLVCKYFLIYKLCKFLVKGRIVKTTTKNYMCWWICYIDHEFSCSVAARGSMRKGAGGWEIFLYLIKALCQEFALWIFIWKRFRFLL